MIFFVGIIFGIFLQIHGQQPTITIRLVGTGSTSSQGRVEIERNGVTGTVCSDKFDDLAAAVVCRQLGFTNGGTAVTDGRFGDGTGQIWLDDVTCQGNENHIELCVSRPFGQNNCGHTEDVGVICNTTLLPSSSVSSVNTRALAIVQPSNCTVPISNIRLVGPSNLNGIGYVEVNRNGSWGSICDDNWGTQDARVVCRMLCYDPKIAQAGAPVDINHAKDNVSNVYLLDDVDCVGTETDIAQCPKSPWGQHNCNASQQEYASVTCVKLDNAQPVAPVPELECSGGKFYARFSRIQDPKLEAKHLSILYPYTGQCYLDKSTNNDSVTITIPYSQCGTNTTTNDTHIVYTNSIKYDHSVTGNNIVRVNTYIIEVSCEFPRDVDTVKGFTPVTETVTKKASGLFIIGMKFYNDSFNTALNDSIQMTLGAWLNVALTLEAIDPNLKLVVPKCKATPTNNSNDPTTFDLFDNKCASEPTLGFFPLNSTVFGFRYQTFKFVHYSNVYIQCDAFVCLISEKNAQCDRSCASTNTGRRKRDVSGKDIYHVISPPLLFQRDGDVVIDRGDGWGITLGTTNGITTQSMSTTVTLKPTTSFSQIMSTSHRSSENPTARTKVIPVTTSQTTTPVTTQRVTSPMTSSTTSSTIHKTTLQPASPVVPSTVSKTTTSSTFKPTTKPVSDKSSTTTSPPVLTSKQTTVSNTKVTAFPLPKMQPVDPNQPYEGEVGGQINILSKASSLCVSFVISLITVLFCLILRY